jgi:multidrug efflux system outer membrane protein
LEVLEIERSLFDAELRLSELTQNQLSSTIQLYRALGGGWN